MKIDERLNLVLPLYRDADPYAWVHSVPISREMFEAHYKLLNRAFTALMNEGQFSGRVAHLLFRDVAKDLAGRAAEGERLAAPVLNEIRRLSNIALATPKGWETLPLDDALSRHLIDADDVAEVLSALVFFTVGWHFAESDAQRIPQWRCENVGCANLIIGLYGILRFLGDLDRDREFWRNGACATAYSPAGDNGDNHRSIRSDIHVVAACLNWVVNEGFAEFFGQDDFDWDWKSAAQFRARHWALTPKG